MDHHQLLMMLLNVSIIGILISFAHAVRRVDAKPCYLTDCFAWKSNKLVRAYSPPEVITSYNIEDEPISATIRMMKRMMNKRSTRPDWNFFKRDTRDALGFRWALVDLMHDEKRPLSADAASSTAQRRWPLEAGADANADYY